MIEWFHRLKDTKFGAFIIKYHLLYLIIPFALWGIKALLYNIVIWIGPDTTTFHFAIDDKIPFIKYFFPFYFSYYFFPPLALWWLSFYNKKKYWILFESLLLSVAVSFIFYCSFNVVMIRQPGYPNGIRLADVHNISSFFDYCINWLYQLDPTAMNCFPSVHAVVGTLCVLIGLYIPKLDEHRLPISMQILCIVVGLGCTISTIFLKQHYLIDVVAGILLEILALAMVWGCHAFVQYRAKKRNSCNESIEEV
ncbi:MAG: phosphatase PAP2 family protein [Anaeroplasmataceae bacterium]|nr:phosphatase PAP2 family protein [Anaeroplasmataceae bacterium]